MNPDSILAWSRGLERLAIVGLSGMSLVLGWDLFRRGVVNVQTADLSAGSWKVRLQRVGPGIFFALFATVAFVSAITHPLEITTGRQTQQDSTANGGKVTVTTERQTIREAASPANSSDRDVVAAINTFHLVLLPRASKELDANDVSAVNMADQTLDSYKKYLMFQHFHQMSIQFYSVRDRVPVEPQILRKQTPEFQDKYPEIEGWDKDTFLRRR
jgi:hypothetical protein